MITRRPSDDAPHQPTAVLSPATRLVHRPWLLALVLVVVTFVVCQPVQHAGFIWDDDDHLTANPAMTAPHGLKMIWSSLAVSRYYPLTLTTFWVQRRLWGLNPLPYHLVNVALHAVNGILIFLVLRRLRVTAAWLAAMLWVLHPVNVESVAWITELKNTQSGVFFFCRCCVFCGPTQTGKLAGMRWLSRAGWRLCSANHRRWCYPWCCCCVLGGNEAVGPAGTWCEPLPSLGWQSGCPR